MAKKNLKKGLLVGVVIFLIFFITFILFEVGLNKTAEWLRERWFDIIIAFIFAIVAGVVIHYVYIKIKPKLKMEQPTILLKKQRPILARLILSNNNEIKITESEKIFGREDFLGAIPSDDLQFIGRQHFKIIKTDDGRYIEDMDSANGTKLDKREIKGSGQQKLEDGAKIQVADVLDLEYKVVIDGK